MDEQEQRAIRYHDFKNHFVNAFAALREDFKTNQGVGFYFDEDWNLFAGLDDERLFYLPSKGCWIKIR